MSDFKELFDIVASGAPRHDLVLVKDTGMREQVIKELFNEAGERGMCPIIRSSEMVMYFDGSSVTLRIAHSHIDRELRGLVWSGIHGLDILDTHDEGTAMKDYLKAMVR